MFYSLEMQLVDLACFGSGKVHFYVLLVLANAECASEWRPSRNVMPKYKWYAGVGAERKQLLCSAGCG